jgi:hypothetical protein
MAGTSGILLRVQKVPFKASPHDIISVPQVEGGGGGGTKKKKNKKKKNKNYSSHGLKKHK